MYFDEHEPPHFHAIYGDYEADVTIKPLQILAGTLPRRDLALVLEWAALHRAELPENWVLCRQHWRPENIQPLD